MKGFKISRILNNKDFIYALSLLTIIGFICISFYELSKQDVTVIHADERTTIRTHANTVADVLDELSIQVGEHDKLSHQTDALVSSDMEIEYTTAKEITVQIDGEETRYFTTSDTVEEFLHEENIELTEHDQISVAGDTEIRDQLTLQIDKAFEVVINDAGTREKVWTTGDSVEDLLHKKDISLDDLDRVEPAETTELENSTEIEITRVEKVTDIVEEEQDYATVKRNDQSLEKGKEEVVEQGSPGVIEKHYEVTLENGEEVARELIKEEVTQESQDRIVAIGTKVNKPEPAQTAKTSASSSSTDKAGAAASSTADKQKTVSRSKKENKPQGKTLYMKATAYNWNCDTCDGRGLTATGYNLKENPNGVVSVDPSVIPLGTKVWVEGYGYAVARDTGGNVKGNKIDLHMPTKQQAASYGTKNVQVKIIE